MTWVKLDDQFASHPKAIAAGPEPMWLYVAGLCWCSQHLTDGLIPKAAVPMLAPVKRTAAAKLVEVGLWHDKGDEYEVNDYLDFQPSRAKVEAEREAAKKRQRESRARRAGRHSVTDDVTSAAPTRPDPTPLLESDLHDDDVGVAGSSSWTLDELYIEAGQLLARCAGHVRNLDNYAAGASGNLRREKRALAERIWASGRYSLEEAAGLLTHPDADTILDVGASFGDWIDAADLPAGGPSGSVV